MGLLSRAGAIIKAKFSSLLNRAENPQETLDYSYEKQLESLQARLDPALASHLAGPRVRLGVYLGVCPGIAHGPASARVDTVPYC